MSKETMLKDLNPGDMFRRDTGTYRYVVSSQREERCGNVSIYCYNLDGSSDGYWHGGSEKVHLVEEYHKPTQLDTTLKKFWMCHVDGGAAPQVRHWDRYTAYGEAERLAKVSGKAVVLLEAVKVVTASKPQPPIVWFDCKE